MTGDDPRSEVGSDWVDAFLGAGRRAFRLRHALEDEMWRGHALTVDEVDGLRRAFTAGLAALDEDETVLVISFHTAKRYQLYLQYDAGVARPGRAWSWSWQEAFTQVAFAAELVLDHGWEPGQVALEVDRLDVAAGVSPVTAPLLLAEAKLTDRGSNGLQPMLAVFRELAGGDPAKVTVAARTNAIPKYEGLLRLRPRVFVAVAPGVRYAFDVRYVDAAAHLDAREAMPAAADLLRAP